VPSPLPLTGYSDPLNAEPGSTVRFHISAPTAYEASLVRLIHGDRNPTGPGFKESEVVSSVDRRFEGSLQSIWMGSCAIVPYEELFDLNSFTIQAWVCPTLLEAGHPQSILAHWSADEPAGYALVIEPEGDLALWIGEGAELLRARTGVPFYVPHWHHREWYFVAATFDAGSGNATLEQTPVSFWPRHPATAAVRLSLNGAFTASTPAPLVLAAAGDGIPFSHQFNGLLDRPRLFRRALTPEELEALRTEADPALVAGDALVAAWDFSLDMPSNVAVDTGPHRLHAQLRNEPDRAMTGPRWKRRETDWRNAPAEYSAIYFHEDDVGDAEWEANVEYTVPTDLPSGVYALRLRDDDGSDDRIPFFVRPPLGQPTADVAVLFPTMTYLAYSNDHCMAWWMHGETNPPSSWNTAAHRPRFEGSPYFSKLDIIMREHPELGCCVYDRLRDGSGTTTVSSRRPMLNFRPDALSWFTGAPRGFASDLCLVDWLEAMEIPYDSLTDHDLHQHGYELLSPYRALILCSHPEYWSQEMYDALHTFIEEGGRVMYLGGNSHYYITSLVPDRPWIMECRKTWDQVDQADTAPSRSGPSYGVLPWERVHTTGEVGGMWQYRGQSPRDTIGVDSIAGQWQRKEPGYRRLPDSYDDRARFIFQGVHETELIGDFGLVQGGAAGDETDGVDFGPGTPPHILVLATSAGLHQEGGKAAPYWHRADIAYMEGPNGGAVFSVGSINWVSSLSSNSYENNVSRITRNILERFRDPEPLDSSQHPSEVVLES